VQKTIEGFVRLGYVAKAVVYLLIGMLALRMAIGARGGRITDPGGALYVVLRQPMGSVLVLLLAIGLLMYAGWQIAAAILGWRRQARERAWSRALTIVRAAVYGAIGVQALRLAIGLRAGHSGPQPLVRTALHWPFGKWMVLAAGLGAMWYGIVEIRDAINGRLEPDLDAASLRRSAGAWALDVARAGIFARAVVLIVLGAGVVRAALAQRASAAGGMGASLVVLNSLPSGTLVLGATAAGLLAYGVYQLLHARYANL
jgi:Domain of Unknown Function (DUF1206)